jgi:Transposase domain (DUF772)
MRFLDLGLEDPVPDATTIWLFREAVVDAGLIDKLFDRFGQHRPSGGADGARGPPLPMRAIFQAGTTGTLFLRNASANCGPSFKCAFTSSGGVSAIHWLSEMSA